MPITQSRLKSILDSARSLSTAYHQAMAELRQITYSYSKGDIPTKTFYDLIVTLHMGEKIMTAEAEGLLLAEETHYRLTVKQNEAKARYMARKRGGLLGAKASAKTASTMLNSNYFSTPKIPSHSDIIEVDAATQKEIDIMNGLRPPDDPAGAAMEELFAASAGPNTDPNSAKEDELNQAIADMRARTGYV